MGNKSFPPNLSKNKTDSTVMTNKKGENTLKH